MQFSLLGSDIGQNLDIAIDLLDAAGNTLYTHSPARSLDAELIWEVDGTRYVQVRSTGEYGRIGQYTLSATESLPGVSVVLAHAKLRTSELGSSESFTVALTSRPLGDVIIPVSSTDPTEGSVSASSLTFTPQNWFLPQTVTVTGVDDGQLDGISTYQIGLGPAQSADPDYSGLTIAALPAENADDDTPGWAFQLSSCYGAVYAQALTTDSAGNIYMTG